MVRTLFLLMVVTAAWGVYLVGTLPLRRSPHRAERAARWAIGGCLTAGAAIAGYVVLTAT